MRASCGRAQANSCRARLPARAHGAAQIGGGPTVLPPSPLTAYQPTCKPGSVWPAADAADVTAIPLVHRLPGASCNLPERLIRTDRDVSPRKGISPAPLLFGFAPGGVCRAASVAGSAVRSYRTVSPLPRSNATHRGGLFSVALSLGAPESVPAGRYPAPFVHGARTFLPGRLSALAWGGRPAD